MLISSKTYKLSNPITTIANTIPPIVPSQVFLGDTFVKGVFPMIDPTMYAIVSLIQIEKTIIGGITLVNSNVISAANFEYWLERTMLFKSISTPRHSERESP